MHHQPTIDGKPITIESIAGGFIFGIPIMGAINMTKVMTAVAITPAIIDKLILLLIIQLLEIVKKIFFFPN